MIAASPDELRDYWLRMAHDMDPSFHQYMAGRDMAKCVPIVIWGDEGTVTRRSWMVTTWILGLKSLYLVIVDFPSTKPNM